MSSSEGFHKKEELHSNCVLREVPILDKRCDSVAQDSHRSRSVKTLIKRSKDPDQSYIKLVDTASDRVLSKLAAAHTKEDAYAISARRGQ